ncbi:hypothetical protein M2272_003444 [Mycobacterium frederiksbergense]|uniref:Capsular polysaccharide biosynthesis protein n=1 Tax=Mycolicibacterium frederiksbergense TaxID=117567 RepID=A0ABT6L1G5_9MYCO|nr:hypothetical protein [Mycolicibacterium frederiksbergense]MDH6196791.1 hypothetical protein [Mycolicibacterium frederiksbergense]
MDRKLLAHAWVVATLLAVIGLLAGVVAAVVLSGREPARYTAEATLAMLPSQQVPVTQAPGFWEVLSRGQATRSASIVLNDRHWLGIAAGAAGVPESELEFEAGAISDTTLITMRMKATTAAAAEAALNKVLSDALVPAAGAAGPFRLEVVSSPDGSAQSSAPGRTQMFGALGLAGLLVGGGAGVLVSRWAQRPRRRHAADGAAVGGRRNDLGEKDIESAVSQTPTL